MNMRIAIYARVSSQKQADERTIQSQRQEIIDRIVRDGLEVEQGFEFCDDGYSGSELLRPALEKLRDRIAGSLVDRLYVHSPDRLARKFAHEALLLEEFRKHDCEACFLDHQDLPESAETNLLLQMQGIIAEYEREKILERTRRGRRYAANSGSVSVFSGAPYGYRYVSKSRGGGSAQWELDPVKSNHIRLMFELVGERGFSLRQVCHELHARGIETSTGREYWDRATVRDILKRHAYYGEARYGKERLTPRKPGRRPRRGDPEIPRRAKVGKPTPLDEQIVISVPAIVSRELFELAGRKMEENRKRKRERDRGPRYLLSGLLVCGKCGSAYCGQRLHGKPAYYRCVGATRRRIGEKPICDNHSVKAPQLETCVWQELCNLLQDPSRLEAELERRRSESPPSPSQLANLERVVHQLRGRLDRLIDAFESGLIEKNEFEKRITPLRDKHDRELSALNSLRGELATDDDPSLAMRQTLAALAARVNERLKQATEETRRELLMLLVKRIEIHADEIRIVYKVPQRPFVPSPASRGDLKHWVPRQVAALHTPSQCRSTGAASNARTMLQDPAPCPNPGRPPPTGLLRFNLEFPPPATSRKPKAATSCRTPRLRG